MPRVTSNSTKSAAAIVINEDQVAITEPASQPPTVLCEQGQALNDEDRDTLTEHMETGGSFEIVTENHWQDQASAEHMTFYEKLKAAGEKLRGAKKEEHDELIRAYEHAMEIQALREKQSEAAGGATSKSDKHDRAAMVAAAQARQAAETQGASANVADAAEARALGERQEKRAEDLEREMRELRKAHQEALDKAEEAHKQRLVAVAKEAKEQAQKEAETLGTRSNKRKAAEAEAVADAAEAAMADGDEVVLDESAAGGRVGELMRENGIGEGGEGGESGESGNTAGAASSSSSSPAVPAPKSRKKAKTAASSKKRVRPAAEGEHGEEGAEEQDDEDAPPKKRTAAELYRELGITGKDKFGKMFEMAMEKKKADDAEEEDESNKAPMAEELNRVVAKHKALKEKSAALKMDRNAVMERLNKAIEVLHTKHKVSEAKLIKLGIMEAKEEEDEEE